MVVDIDDLSHALQKSWSKQTSSNPNEWSKDNPARGQCVPTALVIQDYLGGDLVRYEVSTKRLKETHYANLTEDKSLIDLTICQYQEPVKMIIKPVNLANFDSVRNKRLSDKSTKDRYLLLKKLVAKDLNK